MQASTFVAAHAHKLIAVGSGRGGSGKSTVSLALAHALAAAHGRTVALVDLDPQGSCTSYAGSRSVADPLTAPPVEVHGIRLYRGGEMTAQAVAGDIESHLVRAMADVDVVIVDLSPALDLAHEWVLQLTTLLVLAVELEPGSLAPAAKLIKMAENAGVEYEVLGNKLNMRTVTAAVLMTLQGSYGLRVSDILIKDDVKAPESIAHRIPVTQHRRTAAASKALFAFAGDLVARGLA